MPHTELDVAWTLITPPTEEPITLEEAKAQARLTGDEDNALVASYIAAAREACEQYMHRALLTQTWQLVLSAFANEIPLPMAWPLQNAAGPPSTAPTVQYYDADGVLQTLATTVYAVDTLRRPGRIVLAPDQTWPTLESTRLSPRVLITYVAGYTTASDVPELIKQGIKLWVTYLDCDRDGQSEYGLHAMQAAYRCWGDRISWSPPTCPA